MRVAIIHPWFVFAGGGERVTGVLAAMYPDADIHSLVVDPKFVPQMVSGHQIRTSFLNNIPASRRLYRHFMPLHTFAAESLDLTGYELVISSDYSVGKGVLVDQGATHISYCHTPARYLWDQYRSWRHRQPRLFRPIFTLAAHYARTWDYVAAQRVDAFIANSQYVANRIWQYYQRDSEVIYPPIETAKGYVAHHTENYYLSVGRLTFSKRLDLIIEACNRLGRKLLIAGTGREEKALKEIAGKTIQFLGHVPDSALASLYAQCRAFVFAADEDFGMVSVEAQAYGRPVIAYGHGGSLETVRAYGLHQQPTGVFFKQQTVEAVRKAILDFETREAQFCPDAIRSHALSFDTSVFTQRMKAFVDCALSARRGGAVAEQYTAERSSSTAAGM
jgi:glycosyltransferase involved in cell wall biosynthesis